MQKSLNEDDAAEPAVQEIEMLVGNTCKQRQNALAIGEKDGKGRQSEGQCANAVGEAAETCAGIVQRRAVNGSDPGSVDDADKTWEYQ